MALEQIKGQTGDLVVKQGQWPVAHPFKKGKLMNGVAIGAGATATADLDTTGYSTLTLLTRLTAGASGDLTGPVANPFEDDGTTSFSVTGLPLPYGAAGPNFSGGVAAAVRQYNLMGVDKVRVSVTNNNAGSQTATTVYYLQK